MRTRAAGLADGVSGQASSSRDRVSGVIGTITLGAVAGGGPGGLVYFDGDADLNTPERSGSQVADTMGMTHMLGGGSPRLARLGARFPLLRPGQVVLFGFDPAGQAGRALGYLNRRCDSYLVHFDVDVLHTGLFPLANFPHFAGLTLDEAGACLDVFAGGEKFGGLVITEVNPGHDPSGELLRTLAARVTRALAPAG